MMTYVFTMVVGVLGASLGFFSLRRAILRHRLIDTESVGIITEVQDLGISNGRKAYAIKYKIQAHEPFELVDAPCKKKMRPGSQRTVFYEKQNPNKNYYFKTIAQFDRRLLSPGFLSIAGIALFLYGIGKIIGL